MSALSVTRCIDPEYIMYSVLCKGLTHAAVVSYLTVYIGVALVFERSQDFFITGETLGKSGLVFGGKDFDLWKGFE